MNGRRCDIISTLPQNIIENILTLMPIRDAVSTCILSTKWRYSWTTIPKLVFDYKFVFGDEDYEYDNDHEFMDTIFHVLLLHRGPILEFKVSADRVSRRNSKFDLIIHLLSRKNDLKTLNINISNNAYRYMLPASFFSLQGLQELQLTSCDFKSPLAFNGLSRLQKVCFKNVTARPKMVLSFLSKCPLLEEVTLMMNVNVDKLMKTNEYAADLAGRNTSTFVELLPCVPFIQCLILSKYYFKYMAAGGMLHKLPVSLFHLKKLCLAVCLMEQHEISSLLCIIKSSPNLEEMAFRMYDNEKLPVRQTSVNFLNPYSNWDLYLNRLENFEIGGFSNLPLEIEFVKLVMAKSPVLKKARIELSHKILVDEELKIVKDFLLLPFSRGPTAKLIIERPKPLSRNQRLSA